jgi:hypothetical protein
MSDQLVSHIFLSYNDETQDFVEVLARRLQGDARLSVWFGPWHSIPGIPIQEQMEEAVWTAQACALFVGGSGQIEGWQNEQMRTAIQTPVEDESSYRVIPVLVPGATRPDKRDLPPFLRCYEMVEFAGPHDEVAFKRLLAGILGIPPIQVEGYLQAQADKARLPLPPSGTLDKGRALVVGVANYPRVRPLPDTVLNDARDLATLLIGPARCGYLPNQVIQLLDGEATGEGIRSALADMAARAGRDGYATRDWGRPPVGPL